ncbi:hypothetical protein AYL99_10252 [Fonsecaea erecta]|uniref:Uncharacterized protein n=1 Tax=Fonsecaea erecta TaxID=1367422 RepID=A0A178Z687_9EURO|nr:hypothetical protein AYL99_10252 [Fonsecaea erecta]OAP55279.1 hypothetical protein AYL99_10252 [Fonsecaea erecta]
MLDETFSDTQFREQTVITPFNIMTFWSSYKALSPKTRAVIGVALMLNASAMLLFSDQIEASLGLSPPPDDRQKVFKVYSVERETKG